MVHVFGRVYGWSPQQIDEFSPAETNYLMRRIQKDAKDGVLQPRGF